MKLLLKLIQQQIASYSEIKDLSDIQQKQLAIEIKAYFGKKISLKTAFKDECIADFWQVAEKDKPDTILYDFWQINSDSGGVFFTNTTEETGVEMIQGSYGVQADFAHDKNAKLLAAAFETAERIKAIKSDYILNKNNEIDDFKSPEFTPTDFKQWAKFLKNQEPSETFIRKYHASFNKSCWDLVSTRAKLSEDFLVEFSKKINWQLASQYQKLSEKLMAAQKDKLDWVRVCLYQELSENFIRTFQDLVNWDYLSGKQKLSEAFIREFQNKVSWDAISWGQRLSDDFILEFQDKMDWENMLMYQRFSEDFLRKFIPQYDWGCWCYLSQHQNISVAFILEFADKIQWSSLSMNPHLTDEHLRKFKEKIEWGALVGLGRGLSEALIMEFQECISKSESSNFTWKNILENKKKFVLSEEFRKEILKKIG